MAFAGLKTNPSKYREFVNWVGQSISARGHAEVSILAFEHFAGRGLLEPIHPLEQIADALYRHETGKCLIEKQFDNTDAFYAEMAKDLGCAWYVNPERMTITFRKIVPVEEKEPQS